LVFLVLGSFWIKSSCVFLVFNLLVDLVGDVLLLLSWSGVFTIVLVIRIVTFTVDSSWILATVDLVFLLLVGDDLFFGNFSFGFFVGNLLGD